MCDDTELLLMFAARAQHLHEVICPALENGKWVICDRFTDATYAYQGGGRGISVERILQLENWVQGEFRPDMTIIFDLSVEVGLQRANNRSEPDRFEQENVDFFNRVRNAYLERAAKSPQHYAIVDAEPDLDTVQQNLLKVLKQLAA
jgi:dTMP kinase